MAAISRGGVLVNWSEQEHPLYATLIAPYILAETVNKIIFWTLKAFEGEEFATLSGAQADFLSAAEKQRLSELKFPKRRIEWLRGRWVAKQLLYQVLDGGSRLSPQDLTIANDAMGAPYVIMPSGERFNGCLSISHCDRLAFCAITTDTELRIGADVERIEPRSEAFIRDYFTAKEIETVLNQPQHLQPDYTTLIWSAKEASLKALGIGLRVDLRRVEIRLGAGVIMSEHCPHLWQSMQIHLAGGEEQPVSGWWQRRGDYVLTLVSL